MSANVDLDAKRLVPLKAWGRCRGCWSSSSSYPRSKMVWQWRRLRSSSASFSESLGKLLRVTGEAEVGLEFGGGGGDIGGVGMASPPKHFTWIWPPVI